MSPNFIHAFCPFSPLVSTSTIISPDTIIPTMFTQGVRVLTFDLDNTLWHTVPVILAANKALHAHLASLHPEISKLFPPEKWRDLQNKIMEDNPSDRHDLTAIRKRALEYTARVAYPNLDAAAITGISDDAFAAFIKKRNDTKGHLFPEVIETLQTLKGRGYVLGSLTNGNADVFSMPHLEDLFSFSVSAISAGAAKPDRRPFHKAFGFARLHGQAREPSQVFHVGDSIYSDVVPAKLYGFQTCWVRTGDDRTSASPTEADVVVQSFVELRDMFPGPFGDGDGKPKGLL